jgi:hypothetical protein
MEWVMFYKHVACPSVWDPRAHSFFHGRLNEDDMLIFVVDIFI